MIKTLKKDKLLGEGTYGEVYRYVSADGKAYSVKTFNHEYGITELSLVGLDHPNVIKVLEAGYMENDRQYIIMDMAQSDLSDVPPEVSLKQKVSLCWQVANGIAYLNSLGIYHLDIKPQNCLLFHTPSGYTAQVTDLGLSRFRLCKDQAHSRKYEEVYTLYYRPPEVLLGGASTLSSEVWALACTMYEIMTGKILFEGQGEIDQLFTIFKKLGTPTTSGWPDVVNLPDWKPTFPQWKATADFLKTGISEMDNLLLSMLQMNPDKRPTIYQILDHPVFHNVKKIKQAQPRPSSDLIKFFELSVKQYFSRCRSEILKRICRVLIDRPAREFFLAARYFDLTYDTIEIKSEKEMYIYLGVIMQMASLSYVDVSSVLSLIRELAYINLKDLQSMIAFVNMIQEDEVNEMIKFMFEALQYRPFRSTVFDYLVCNIDPTPQVTMKDSNDLVKNVAKHYIFTPKSMTMTGAEMIELASN